MTTFSAPAVRCSASVASAVVGARRRQHRASNPPIAVVPPAVRTRAVEEQPLGFLDPSIHHDSGALEGQKGIAGRLDPAERAIHPGPASQGSIDIVEFFIRRRLLHLCAKQSLDKLLLRVGSNPQTA